MLVVSLLFAAAAYADPPPWLVEQALCVHSGWHYTSTRQHGPPEYTLYGHGYWRTTDVPDSWAGGSGEAGWGNVNSSYGGGMQFTLGTWNRAAALSHGQVPAVRWHGEVALQPAAVQILAASLIVVQDGGSWREWPQTSRACGWR